MEAGYDYLLLRSSLQQRFVQASATLLVVVGVVSLSAGIAYFIYAQQARSSLDRLNYTVPPPAADSAVEAAPSSPLAGSQVDVAPGFPDPLGSQLMGEGGLTVDSNETASLANSSSSGTAGGGISEWPQPSLDEGVPSQVSAAAIAERQLYPGEAMKATYWSNPLEYEPDDLQSSLIQGFKPISPTRAAAVGTLAAPTRILVPSIGVESDVEGLRVMDLGDSRAYETPKHIVGHIPEYANPGENGSAWFFGHLESPIAGEGNVFYALPQIPDFFREGQDVYVIVESGPTSYLYRIMETRVVHQDDMKLYDSGGPAIHLVACVPRFVYDHRLVVTGTLVGVRS